MSKAKGGKASSEEKENLFGRSQSYRVATTPLVADGSKGKKSRKDKKKEKKENLEDLKKELEIDWHTIPIEEVYSRLETNVETVCTILYYNFTV